MKHKKYIRITEGTQKQINYAQKTLFNREYTNITTLSSIYANKKRPNNNMEKMTLACNKTSS